MTGPGLSHLVPTWLARLSRIRRLHGRAGPAASLPTAGPAPVSALARSKKAARAAGFAAREAAHRDGAGRRGWPPAMRSRRSRLCTMCGWSRPICRSAARSTRARRCWRCRAGLPSLRAGHRRRGLPLRFRAWTPGARVVHGNFGVEVPAAGDWLEPEVLLVPLVAFDGRASGWATAADSTTARSNGLRARGPVHAYGFAYEGQRVAGGAARPERRAARRGDHRKGDPPAG